MEKPFKSLDTFEISKMTKFVEIFVGDAKSRMSKTSIDDASFSSQTSFKASLVVLPIIVLAFVTKSFNQF